MKNFFIPLLFILIGCLLWGCAGESGPTSIETDSTSIEMIEPSTSIPILSIETKNQSSNALDFVKKKVASHVAESIASWTPSYVMPPAPYYEACTVSLTDADETLLLDAVDAEVKVRGNWTTSYSKKALRI